MRSSWTTPASGNVNLLRCRLRHVRAQLARLGDYYQMGNFLHNIQVCARRIADLVKGIKQYFAQDNAVAQRVDLLEGLEDTSSSSKTVSSR